MLVYGCFCFLVYDYLAGERKGSEAGETFKKGAAKPKRPKRGNKKRRLLQTNPNLARSEVKTTGKNGNDQLYPPERVFSANLASTSSHRGSHSPQEAVAKNRLGRVWVGLYYAPRVVIHKYSTVLADNIWGVLRRGQGKCAVFSSVRLNWQCLFSLV